MKQFEAHVDKTLWDSMLTMIEEKGGDIENPIVILSDINIAEDKVAIIMSPRNVQALKEAIGDRFIFPDDIKLEPSGAV